MAESPEKLPACRKPFMDVPTMLEIGVALSMALLLAFFLRKIFLAPASVPLYYITYRKGPVLGIFTCLLFSLITLPLAMMNLPHPVVFIETPLEYLAVAIAGFFPMREGKGLSFKELFKGMGETGIWGGFKNLRANFLRWLYDTRGIVLSSVLRYIVVVLGSAVFAFTYYSIRPFFPHALIFSMVMEWKAAFPGLIFFMVVVPILVKYRMDFREHKRPHEYNFQEAKNVPFDTADNKKSK